jgi:hypothetical protein
MTKSELIQTLQAEAKNPVANDLFHAWALRKRARHSVALPALVQRMHREGFAHPKEAYVPVLKTLASMGFGKLDVDPKGRIRGLKEVQTTLQSIGKAALGQSSLNSFHKRNRFKKLEESKTRLEISKKRPLAKKASLTVYVNGKPVSILLPDTFTAEDVVNLINKFRIDTGSNDGSAPPQDTARTG